MIVVVTNRSDQTADYLILELQRRGLDYVRFNTEDFPQKAKISWQLDNEGIHGCFSLPKLALKFDCIKSIWYRRPVPPVPSPSITDPVALEFAKAESQAAVEGLWRSLDCFWVSHPDSLRKAESKLYQLKKATEVGLHVSPTLLTNDPEVARSYYEHLGCNMVYKPLRRARLLRGDEVSLVYTNPVNVDKDVAWQSIRYAPVLLQEYVPKLVEIRVTVIGQRVFAAEIHSQEHELSRHDWRKANSTELQHRPHSLPQEVSKACQLLVKSLDLQFSAIDMVLTPGKDYVFLEANPNGQWAWIQQLCPEIKLREALADLLESGGG